MDASDPNYDKLEYYIKCSPSKGHLEIKNINEGSFVYTPINYENGEDAFVFQVSDGQYESEPTPIFIYIHAINNNPIANDLIIDAWESEKILFNLSAFDIDGEDEIVDYIIIQEPIDKDALIISSSTKNNSTPLTLRRGVDPFAYLNKPSSSILSSGIRNTFTIFN